MSGEQPQQLDELGAIIAAAAEEAIEAYKRVQRTEMNAAEREIWKNNPRRREQQNARRRERRANPALRQKENEQHRISRARKRVERDNQKGAVND